MQDNGKWIDVLEDKTWKCKDCGVTVGGRYDVCPICDYENKKRKQVEEVKEIIRIGNKTRKKPYMIKHRKICRKEEDYCIDDIMKLHINKIKKAIKKHD